MTVEVVDFRDVSPEAVLLDALGGILFVSKPGKELGVLLDLEGMTNRPPSRPGNAAPSRARCHHRYLLSIGVARELRDELDRLIPSEAEEGLLP